ncbi:MAG: C4-dicarboxylate ABC transporter permease [Gammaproteobacteria bacterium HGW-Gammaproteobacteria-1]|jgi:TRAP-type mannitol/chloroaromatic compound transport system permease small subunit|nr:MAG: C4-dicarboxylate ABC transporter permease [Gammaproteobacteria bacterium HGW-Gammaproteobacteria-1]
MQQQLEQIAAFIDGLNEWTGRLVAWLTLAMVLVTGAVVLLRYAFDLGWIAVQESITYLHALVFMLGAAYTLRHDGHVRVDIFYRRLAPRGQAWVDLLGALLLLLPVCVFILWISWDYVAASWSLWEGSRDAGGLPLVYLLKGIIPAMALLLLLQGVSQALRSLLVLLGHAEDAPAHDAKVEV